MSKTLTIIDIIKNDMEDYSEAICKLLEKDNNYMKSVHVVEETLKTLKSIDNEMSMELDSAVGVIEYTTMDIAYQEGFSTAIKLILGAMGGVSNG